MSITKLSGLGSVLITLLLLAVVGFAYNQNRKTNDLMESNISIAAPARDAPSKVDSLIADSAFQFVQFLNRDTIRGEDVREILNQLVAVEHSVIARLSRKQSGGFLQPRYARTAIAAFNNFLDEEENDPASDTTIALKERVGSALGGLRTALSRAPNETFNSGNKKLSIEFRRFRNLLASSEVALERYFNRTAVYLIDVLNPIDRSIRILGQIQADVAAPKAHTSHSHSHHTFFEMLDLERVMKKAEQPIAVYRASLFIYGDAIDSGTDGTALDELRDAARSGMHAARRDILRTLATLDRNFDAYQTKLLSDGRQSQKIFLIIAVIGVVAAGVTTLLIQNRIAARLAIVTDSARRISRGDLGFRIDIEDSDGLGILAAEFNMLATKLAARERMLSDQLEQINRAQRDLKNMNRDLEDRVKARTAELEDSEQRLNQLIESYVSGIYIHKDFKPIYANQTLLDMFGFDGLEDFLAIESTESLLAPEERERIWGYHQARLRGDSAPPDYDFWALTKNGEKFCVNNRSFVVNWGGQQADCTTLYDLTAKRETEKSLAEQQHLMNALLENTHEGFWFIDLEGVTTDLNPAMGRLLDRPREEIIGRTIFDFVDEENTKVFNEQLARRKKGTAGAYEIELQRSDGSNIACLNNATPLFTSDGVRIGSVGVLHGRKDSEMDQIVRDVAGEGEAERQDRSQKYGHQYAQAAVAFIFGPQTRLDVELIGTAIPNVGGEHQQNQSRPRNVRVADGANQMIQRRVCCGHALEQADHTVGNLKQTDDGNQQAPGQQQHALQRLRPRHRQHSTIDGIDAGEQQ